MELYSCLHCRLRKHSLSALIALFAGTRGEDKSAENSRSHSGWQSDQIRFELSIYLFVLARVCGISSCEK